jgi:hypothetical protein
MTQDEEEVVQAADSSSKGRTLQQLKKEVGEDTSDSLLDEAEALSI